MTAHNASLQRRQLATRILDLKNIPTHERTETEELHYRQLSALWALDRGQR